MILSLHKACSNPCAPHFPRGESTPSPIGAMQALPVTDLTITEPTLEEIFLHFYAEGGERT